MTRGARSAADADIQAGNGSARPRGTTTGRGRLGNWIAAASRLCAATRIRVRNWIRAATGIGAGNAIGNGTPIRARNWIRAETPIRAGTRIRARNWIRAENAIRAGTRIRARHWFRTETPIRARHWIRAETRIRTGPWIRAGAIAGVVGPAAFTIAWIAAAFRQPGLPFSAPQISGLAADNARDPWLMISAFLLLGGCAISFGAALGAGLGGRQAGLSPWLIELAGVLTIAAGLLRRDHVLLTAGPESWHNQAHDVISAAAYALLIAAPLLLARRLRRDRQWSRLTVPLVAAPVAAAALLAALYAEPNASWAATLQRIGVSLPLAAIAAVAIRLAALAGPSGLTGSAGRLPDRRLPS